LLIQTTPMPEFGSDDVDLEGSDADRLKLLRYVVQLGATRREAREAIDTGTLGPLALELALRQDGDAVPFSEAASRAGLSTTEAAALWQALGFPDPTLGSVTLGPTQIDTLRVLAIAQRSLLGPEATLGLARAIGAAVARIAESVVDAFRVKVEMPRRRAGEPYSDVVEDYARTASELFPALAEAVTDTLRAHVLAVSRTAWTLDAEQATVTRELTVGFADLVGYTSSVRLLSPAALAAKISRFEAQVGDVVARFGGRVVKLIGDEAMFVIDDRARGCELASALNRTLDNDQELPAVRIGLAAGPIVSHHGDYYGDVVNLAARLVKVAQPGEILISESLASELSGRTGLERVSAVQLKGYEADVVGYRLNPNRAR
jgi:adenylate cyclase